MAHNPVKGHLATNFKHVFSTLSNMWYCRIVRTICDWLSNTYTFFAYKKLHFADLKKIFLDENTLELIMHIWWQSYNYFKNKKWYCALNWLFQNKVNNHFYSLILFPVQWECILFITYGEHFYFYINQSLYVLARVT